MCVSFDSYVSRYSGMVLTPILMIFLNPPVECQYSALQ